MSGLLDTTKMTTDSVSHMAAPTTASVSPMETPLHPQNTPYEDVIDLEDLPSALPPPHVGLECQAIFWLFGCCAGFFWEELLNCLPALQSHIFSSATDLAADLTSVFNTAILIAATVLIYWSPLKASLVLSAAFFLLAASVGVAFISTVLAGSTTGLYSLLFVGLVAGLATGVAESSTFAYGLCLHPSKLAGCFSTGFGLSGIISFLCWSGFSRLLWPSESLGDSQRCVIAQQVVSALVAGGAFVSFLRLRHLEEWKIWQSRSSSSHDLQQPLLDTVASCRSQVSMTLIEVVKATWTCQWHLGQVLWISYAIVPNLTPLQLHLSTHQQDLLVGAFQVCDFLGRWFATQSDRYPWIALKERTVARLSHARLLLLCIALITMTHPTMPVLSSFWFQCIFIVITGLSSGWFLTLLMMYLGRPLQYDDDKGRATAVSVMTQLSGVVGGLYFTDLALLIFAH